MSIRQYNPGRNRRGRISVAAERFLYFNLFLTIVAQITFLFNKSATSLLIAALSGAVFSLAHAQLAYAKRYFWSYLLFTLIFGSAIEYTSINTAWPFGELKYQNLGLELFGLPILILILWLATIHPLLIMARRIAPNWVLLSGAAAITSYQLFLDQFLVSNKYKSWSFSGAHIPFQTHIPLANSIGWLFVGVVFFGLANLILPKDRRKVSASLTAIDIFLVWIWLYNFTANAFFFARPGTALLGGLAFGALLIPYLSSRYLGQP